MPETTAPIGAKVNVETIGPCKKRISVEIAPKRIDEEFEKTYGTLSDNAVLPGFRRGHAPRKLLEKRFAKEVENDVKESLVSESFKTAVEDNKLDTLGEPTVENITYEHGKPLTYQVTVEIRPEFELKNYKGLNLKKTDVPVTEKSITEAVDNLRKRLATWEVVGAKGKVETEDQVICDCAFKMGAVEHVEKNVPVLAGAGNLAGLRIEKLNESLKGKKANDTVTLTGVKLPSNFKRTELQGKDVEVTLTVLEIKRAKLPELTEAWAKDLGFESLDKLKDEIKQDLVAKAGEAAEEALRNQVLEKLLADNTFELPEDLLKRQAEDMALRRQYQMLSRGTPQEEIDKELDALKTQSNEFALKSLRLYFILEKIAKAEKVFATEDDVINRINAIAANYQRPAQKVAEELAKQGRIAQLRLQIREDKTVEAVRKLATVA